MERVTRWVNMGKESGLAHLLPKMHCLHLRGSDGSLLHRNAVPRRPLPGPPTAHRRRGPVMHQPCAVQTPHPSACHPEGRTGRTMTRAPGSEPQSRLTEWCWPSDTGHLPFSASVFSSVKQLVCKYFLKKCSGNRKGLLSVPYYYFT